MSEPRWKQVKTIFQESLRKDTAERDVYLDAVCGNDVDLRIEVESLLISLNEAKSFLETPLLRTSARSYSQWQLVEGQEISHYKIIKTLGAGGMGEVYLAEDKKLQRSVALKLLPRSMVTDRQRLRRFRREALAVSALNHPNILTIFEADSVDGVYLFAAEYVSGETLREKLKHDDLPIDETLDIAVQIVSALRVAHNAGIIHRDIKPENIMIRDDGYVKVLDFGLAKLMATPYEMEMRSQLISNPSTLMGTASYMSPEQVRGHATDARSDIFSFGVVLYEMLWGLQAFTGETNTDVIAAVIQKDLEPPRISSEVPAELVTVVNRCVEKERLNRYQSAEELLADLKKLKPRFTGSGLRRHEDAVTELENEGWLNDADEDRPIDPKKLAYMSAILLLVALLTATIYFLMFR
jgi:serine/threonine protein kinase